LVYLPKVYQLFYGTYPFGNTKKWAAYSVISLPRLRLFPKRLQTIYDKSIPCEFFWDILPIEQRPPSGCEIESEHDLVHFHQPFEELAGLGPEFLYRVLHLDRGINTRGF